MMFYLSFYLKNTKMSWLREDSKPLCMNLVFTFLSKNDVYEWRRTLQQIRFSYSHYSKYRDRIRKYNFQGSSENWFELCVCLIFCSTAPKFKIFSYKFCPSRKRKCCQSFSSRCLSSLTHFTISLIVITRINNK